MLNLFLMEYITAGGFNRQALPPNLRYEAIAMRNALLDDFYALGVPVLTTYDARLTPPNNCSENIAITPEIDPLTVWHDLLTRCDAALIIAPESQDILLKMTHLLEQASVINLGCNSCAVQLTSNKLRTYEHLITHKIRTIPTYLMADDTKLSFLPIHQAYIVKPIDGVGCEETWLFNTLDEMQDWRNIAQLQDEKWICQPYIVGEAASFTMLIDNANPNTKEVRVLSCNSQTIVNQKVLGKAFHALSYAGGVVNQHAALLTELTTLAHQIANSIDGLNGFVGVDVILNFSPSNVLQAIDVVEINPRITTSYVGLHESLQYNPAQFLLNRLDHSESMMTAKIAAMPINITLND